MDTAVAEIRQVGERLRAVLGSFVAALPPQAQRMSGMSSYLGVDRSICQRLLAGTSHRGDPVHVVSKIPGVRGLRMIAAAAGERGVPDVEIQAVESAVDDFANLIAQMGGSQSAMARQLRSLTEDANARRSSSPAESNGSDDERVRRAVFEGAAKMMGIQARARVEVAAVRPIPGEPESIELGLVVGIIGVVRNEGAVPFAFQIYIDPDDLEDQPAESRVIDPHSLDPDAELGRSLSPLVDQFCTQPLPSVFTRLEGGGMLQVVDLDRTVTEPLDVVLHRRISPVSPHPARLKPPILLLESFQNRPAKDMIRDSYVHRDLARASIPAMSVFSTGPRGSLDAASFRSRWFDRLPRQPELRILGEGISQAGSDIYPRHAELTQYLFDSLGWDPAEFVGYRCRERYPIWSANYVMSFDFSTPENA
ncbi:MAG: hypothetical protein KAS72_02845 [Phycisphaerales bacterium]|nr:hypothetical protein [Phycisphaerales bacterium]